MTETLPGLKRAKATLNEEGIGSAQPKQSTKPRAAPQPAQPAAAIHIFGSTQTAVPIQIRRRRIIVAARTAAAEAANATVPGSGTGVIVTGSTTPIGFKRVEGVTG